MWAHQPPNRSADPKSPGRPTQRPNSRPLPPASLPPPAKASKYSRQRQNELNALKSRGIAKLFNKHFTDVTQTVASERAAADAALKELESRRTEFHETNYGAVFNNYDHLYAELKKKQDECKRKEKETVLLYQRYVHKFGNKAGAMAVPNINNNNKTYNSSVVPSSMPPSTPPTFTPSGPPVAYVKEVIESNLQKHLDKGGVREPSSANFGMDETYQSKHEKVDKHEKEFSKQQDDQRTIHARTTPLGSRPPPGKIWAEEGSPGIVGYPDVSTPTGTFSKPPLDPNSTPQPTLVESPNSDDSHKESDDSDKDDDFPCDDITAVSGLTSVDHVSDGEIRLLEFLKAETEAIQLMLDEAEELAETASLATATRSVVSTSDDTNVSESQRATRQAEDMVREMKRVLEEAQTEANSVNGGAGSVRTSSGGSTMSKYSDANAPKEYPYPLETTNPKEQWMVYYDETHRRKYYFEETTNHSQWEKPTNAIKETHKNKTNVYSSTQSVTSLSVRENDTDYVPMADYSKKNTSSRSHPSSLLSYEEVMPDGGGESNYRNSSCGGKGLSRRDQYRRQQRKYRNRKRVAMFVGTLSVIFSSLYLYRNYDTIVPYHVDHYIYDVMTQNVNLFLPNQLQYAGSQRIQQEQHSEKLEELRVIQREKDQQTAAADQRSKQEALKSKQDQQKQEKAERQEKAQAERQAKLNALKQKKNEDELKKKLEQEIRAKIESEARHEEERLAEQQHRRETHAALALLDTNETSGELQMKTIARPRSCNIPLSYMVSGECRRLAKTKPLFNLMELIQAMMQWERWLLHEITEMKYREGIERKRCKAQIMTQMELRRILLFFRKIYLAGSRKNKTHKYTHESW